MNAPLGQISIASMTQVDAVAIADWRYEPPYDFYDPAADARDLAELLDPLQRGDRYFAARDTAGTLIGFFFFAQSDDVVVVGLGLRPDLTGRRLGRGFLEQGLEFAGLRFDVRGFRLSVAAFNKRAISVYERLGFVRTRSFMHETNGGVFPFIEMERPE